MVETYLSNIHSIIQHAIISELANDGQLYKNRVEFFNSFYLRNDDMLWLSKISKNDDGTAFEIFQTLLVILAAKQTTLTTLISRLRDVRCLAVAGMKISRSVQQFKFNFMTHIFFICNLFRSHIRTY